MVIPLDKQAHFLGGYALAVTFGMVNPLLGLAVAVIAAGGKEWYDYNHPLNHTPDIYDFIATSLGGCGGALVVWVGGLVCQFL